MIVDFDGRTVIFLYDMLGGDNCMKRLLVCILLLLLLPIGCAGNQNADNTTSAGPYIDTGSDYTYVMEDWRDRKWEIDIVSFANAYLDPDHGHPQLTDRWTMWYYFNDTNMQYAQSDLVNYFDPELKARFIDKINSLILSIPELSDDEINFGLMESAAMLHDLHSYVSLSMPDEVLPFDVMPVDYNGETFGMIWGGSSDVSELIGKLLIAINDIPLDEVRERIRPIIGYENEASFEALSYSYSYLMNWDVLRYIGVMDEGHFAWITVRDFDGTERKYQITSESYADTWSEDYLVEYYKNANMFTDAGIYQKDLNDQNNVWYHLMKQGEVLYIRFTSCIVDESVGEVFDDAFQAADANEKCQTVILDFRVNSGGYSDLSGNFVKLAEYLETCEAQVFILIDNNSFSAAIGIPAVLRRRLKDATLIGSAGGQQPRFFRGESFSLPYSQIYCQCSSELVDFWPNYENETLTPDLIVRQTYEDYLNGYDSVLKYILASGN